MNYARGLTIMNELALGLTSPHKIVRELAEYIVACDHRGWRTRRYRKKLKVLLLKPDSYFMFREDDDWHNKPSQGYMFKPEGDQ